MKTKAIQDLAQLSDTKLFQELEIGLSHCLKNANRIQADASFLSDQGRGRAAEILRLASQEEAAKVLILVDAVRCPRARQAEFSRQVQYFNQHLAKGIYAEYCGTRPATFLEVRELVELERREYYLDGPNGVDWIYYNSILSRREGTIYVDYVENGQEHSWVDPLKYEDIDLGLGLLPNSVLRVAEALAEVGLFSPSALHIVAETWRGIEMQDDFTWMSLREINHKTLQTLESAGVLRHQPSSVYATVVDDWLFPLWNLDLNTKKVDKRQLREIQARWSPYGDEVYW